MGKGLKPLKRECVRSPPGLFTSLESSGLVQFRPQHPDLCLGEPAAVSPSLEPCQLALTLVGVDDVAALRRAEEAIHHTRLRNLCEPLSTEPNLYAL